MRATEREKHKIKDYYDQQARDYIRQYRQGYDRYPANLIRLKLIIRRLKRNDVKTVLDTGCGTCGPMIKLLKEGFDVEGFDFSKKMIEQGRRELKSAGYDRGLIQPADLESGQGLGRKRFDAALALGVFPHLADEKRALLNMGRLLNPGGLVFIEFRNDLFAAYTLNKYSIDFFLNRVIDLSSLPPRLRGEVIAFYSRTLKVDKPANKKNGKIRYEDISAKFHNPLNIENELFKPCNFAVVNVHFYHYHALPPAFENRHPRVFREMSLKMERPGDWRGYLMASAYVIEAKKKD